MRSLKSINNNPPSKRSLKKNLKNAKKDLTNTQVDVILNISPYQGAGDKGDIMEDINVEEQKRIVRKKVDNRLATIEGHIRAIRKMLSDGKDCIDLITQLLAVERSVRSASILVLDNHLDTCVKEAVINGDLGEVDGIHKLLDMFL